MTSNSMHWAYMNDSWLEIGTSHDWGPHMTNERSDVGGTYDPPTNPQEYKASMADPPAPTGPFAPGARTCRLCGNDPVQTRETIAKLTTSAELRGGLYALAVKECDVERAKLKAVHNLCKRAEASGFDPTYDPAVILVSDVSAIIGDDHG